MARNRKSHSLDEFWVNEMSKPQEPKPQEPKPQETKPQENKPREPKKKPKQKKVKKYTDIDAANKAMRQWFSRVEKTAMAKAKKYLSAFYNEEFRKALKKAMRQTHLSRSERMVRARLPIGAGGFMGFARDEIIPDYKVNSLEEYEPYIANISHDDPQELLRKWRDEAESEIPDPDIAVEDEEPVEFVMPDFFLRRNRRRISKPMKINTDG